MAVEPIVWRTYEQSLPADAVETTIDGHRAAQYWVLKPTYHNSYWYFSCMVAFKTSYGVIQQSLFYSTVYSSPEVDCPSDQPAAGQRAGRRTTSSEPAGAGCSHNLMRDDHLRPTRGSTLRTLPRRLAGRALGRTLRLPAPTTELHRQQRRSPDARRRRTGGRPLRARPATPRRHPAGPRTLRPRDFRSRWCSPSCTPRAATTCVLQSVRGTFGSGGDVRADGQRGRRRRRHRRVAASSSRGSPGGSPPSDCPTWASPSGRCCRIRRRSWPRPSITAGPHDFQRRRRGAPARSRSTTSSAGAIWLPTRKTPAGIRAGIRQLRASRKVARAAAEVPLGAAGRGAARRPAHPGASRGWNTPTATTRSGSRCGSAPRWTGSRCRCCCSAAGRTCSCAQTLQQYRHLRDRGVDVALTIGPWTHTQLLDQGLRHHRARNRWTGWTPTWPAPGPAPSQPGPRLRHRRGLARPARLAAGHHRACAVPAARRRAGRRPRRRPASRRRRFRYDPADPTPTIGGRLLSPRRRLPRRHRAGGARRRAQLHRRRRSTARSVRATATRSSSWRTRSDNPHVDVFVRISEVDAKGRSRNVSDGYRRLDTQPGTGRSASNSTRSRTDSAAGHGIRLLIAGGWFPRYARNLGTGEPPLDGQRDEAGHPHRASRRTRPGCCCRRRCPTCQPTASRTRAATSR